MSDNVIAKSLSLMQNSSNYQEFEEGFFTNRPKMSGYILEIPYFRAKVYVIVNTGKEDLYPRNYFAEDGYHFIIYNTDSLETFINNLPDEASEIIKLLQDIREAGTATGKKLPYGYYEDEEGQIKINSQEATIVRKIFKDYINNRSIRKVARTFKEDYSFIHDILHDVRYARMPIKVVPMVDIRKVHLIIQQNTKNKYRKTKLKRMV